MLQGLGMESLGQLIRACGESHDTIFESTGPRGAGVCLGQYLEMRGAQRAAVVEQLRIAPAQPRSTGQRRARRSAAAMSRAARRSSANLAYNCPPIIGRLLHTAYYRPATTDGPLLPMHYEPLPRLAADSAYLRWTAHD